MKKSIVLAIAVLVCQVVTAQVQIDEQEDPSFVDRLYFSPNFSLSFGTITQVYVSPAVGYMITRSLSAGVGISYQYYRNRFYDYTTHIYGGKLFVRQNIRLMNLPLFLYSEYENLNVDVREQVSPDEFVLVRDWVPSLFFGGGLFQSFGRRGGFYIVGMYNVIYDTQRSPYNSPWVLRVGLTL